MRGADFASSSLKTYSIFTCQSSGTAGVEMRSRVCACTGAARSAKAKERGNARVMGANRSIEPAPLRCTVGPGRAYSRMPRMPIRKILVVDDSATNRHALTEMLAKHGYKCTVAESGKEAIEKAKAEKPDMILMDVVMPDMDGFQ